LCKQQEKTMILLMAYLFIGLIVGYMLVKPLNKENIHDQIVDILFVGVSWPWIAIYHIYLSLKDED